MFVLYVLISIVSMTICQSNVTVSDLSKDHELLEKIEQTQLFLANVCMVILILLVLLILALIILTICVYCQTKKKKAPIRGNEFEVVPTVRVQPTPRETLESKPTSTPVAKVELVKKAKPEEGEGLLSGDQPVLRYHVGKDVRQLELTIPPGANDQAEPQIISESEAFLSNDTNSIQSEQPPPAKRPKLDESSVENDDQDTAAVTSEEKV